MKLNISFNTMHNNVKNNNDYIILIFRNGRHIFDNKINGVYWEYRNKMLKIEILKIQK
jgi:hypothetical protein